MVLLRVPMVSAGTQGGASDPTRSLASASPTMDAAKYWKIRNTFGRKAADTAWAIANPTLKSPGGPTTYPSGRPIDEGNINRAPLMPSKDPLDTRPDLSNTATYTVPPVHYNIPMYQDIPLTSTDDLFPGVHTGT